MKETALFSGKRYTSDKNFTRPPVAMVATNFKSASGFAQKRAQLRSFSQKRAQLSGLLKKSAQERRGVTQKREAGSIECATQKSAK